jgi:ribosomal protein L14E/L6E/L27E
MTDLAVAQIVRSKAGRDKGNFQIIIEIIDDDYVLVCDGMKRKVSNPKKKKKKHLAKTNTIVETISKKIADGGKVTNQDVREALNSFNLRLNQDKREV